MLPFQFSSSSRDFHSQRLSSSSNLLDEMIANSAVKLLPQEGRPPSFQICLLEEEKGLNSLTDDQLSSTEKTGVSPLEEDEKVWPNGDGGLSQLDGANENQPLMEARVLSHPEQNGSQAARPMSQESTTEGAGVPPVENFIFLEVCVFPWFLFTSKGMHISYTGLYLNGNTETGNV